MKKFITAILFLFTSLLGITQTNQICYEQIALDFFADSLANNTERLKSAQLRFKGETEKRITYISNNHKIRFKYFQNDTDYNHIKSGDSIFASKAFLKKSIPVKLITKAPFKKAKHNTNLKVYKARPTEQYVYVQIWIDVDKDWFVNYIIAIDYTGKIVGYETESGIGCFDKSWWQFWR